MKRATTSFALWLAIWTVLPFGACARNVTPLSLVPSGSVAVLKVKWSEVSRDTRLRQIIRGDALERMMAGSGIDSRDVTDLVIFWDIVRARSAMVIAGSARLRASANTLGSEGWQEKSYRGYKFFADASEANCLANLQSGFVVLSARPGVEAVIDTEQAPAQAIINDAHFRKLLAQYATTQPPISLMMTLPPAAQVAGDTAVKAASFLLDFTSFAPLGKLLDKVGLARGIGLSITHSGNSCPVNFVASMKDDDASLVSGTFSVLKGAASWLSSRPEPESDRQMRRAFQNMTITRTRDLVSIALVLPESTIP